MLRISVLFIVITFFISCIQSGPIPGKTKPSFKDVIGTRYTEVRRAFDNGISFNKYGFQLEPEWILQFTAEDSVKIFSPKEKQFIHYPIYYDHDAIFNFAREWFRVIHVEKDSLIFQLLQVHGKVISSETSNVYMTFYSDNYLRNVLHAVPKNLKRPNRKDSLFVRSRVALANSHPDSIFAARNPAVLRSKNAAILVEKVKVSPDPLNGVNPSDAYLLPEYDITIDNAYKEFNYSISVIVNEKGEIHFKQFLTFIMPEFEESKKRIVKALIEGYLKPYVEIRPGNTLGFTHSSSIKLN
ncbi:MAG TPA: hypothetical protein VNI52_04165 [Sphingobacteriaceae bacterium]|nr:hypothetical protein [Sphingobacteriaceae bacterium]